MGILFLHPYTQTVNGMKKVVINGITYWIGTNKYDNSNIVNSADPHDYWFHLSDRSSCHIIAKSAHCSKKQAQKIIRTGAHLLKQHMRLSGELCWIDVAQKKDIATTNEPGVVIGNITSMRL